MPLFLTLMLVGSQFRLILMFCTIYKATLFKKYVLHVFVLPTHGLLKTKAIVGENVDSTCKTWLVISCDVTAKGAKRKNVAVIHTLQPNYRFPGITTLWGH